MFFGVSRFITFSSSLLLYLAVYPGLRDVHNYRNLPQFTGVNLPIPTVPAGELGHRSQHTQHWGHTNKHVYWLWLGNGVGGGSVWCCVGKWGKCMLQYFCKALTICGRTSLVDWSWIIEQLKPFFNQIKKKLLSINSEVCVSEMCLLNSEICDVIKQNELETR